jgi:hypothetical protein
MEWESTQIPTPGKLIIEFNYYVTSYIQWIQLIHSIPNIVSNTLMKLAKRRKLRTTNFELEATCELQTSSLSSKLSVQDDIVWETLYVCNKIFHQRQYFKCVACLEDMWKVWNFHQKKSTGVKDISSEVPKFLDVHHVCLKTFCETPFLRRDCFVYER